MDIIIWLVEMKETVLSSVFALKKIMKRCTLFEGQCIMH